MRLLFDEFGPERIVSTAQIRRFQERVGNPEPHELVAARHRHGLSYGRLRAIRNLSRLRDVAIHKDGPEFDHGSGDLIGLDGDHVLATVRSTLAEYLRSKS